MKKSRPVLFPEFIGNENMSSTVDVRWQDIRPSHKLTIGRPSNRYYEYIYPSLNFKEHSLDNLRELLGFEGIEVYVRSVLKMKNGESYAVLAREGDVPFAKDVVHIYAEIKKSHGSFELLNV
jgi:hypothetical protein